MFSRGRDGSGPFRRRDIFLMEHSGTFRNLLEHFRPISRSNGRLDGTLGAARWVRFSPARKRGHGGTSGDIRGHFRDARWDIWGHALPKSGPLSRGTLWERVREGKRGVEVRSGAKMLRSSAP